MTAVLTPRQVQILGVLRDSVKANGFPPSLQELADAVGLASRSAASYQLRTLQEKGFIKRQPGMPRGLVVLDPSESDEAAVNMERDRIRAEIRTSIDTCVMPAGECAYCGGLSRALQIVGGA